MGTLLISKIREEYPGESYLFYLGMIWLKLTYAQDTIARTGYQARGSSTNMQGQCCIHVFALAVVQSWYAAYCKLNYDILTICGVCPTCN